MPKSTGDLFKEWRAADREAHELEQALAQKCLDALDGRCDPPPLEASGRAKQLRATADGLLQSAMRNMAAHARKNR